MDPAEVEELYRKYGYAVHRRCRRLLRSDAAADDALQEVFIRVLRYGAGFDARRPLAWLYRIADHACFDRLKHERRTEAQQSELQMLKAPPEAEPDQSSEKQLLLGVLAAAKQEQREAASLHYIDGLTHAEIATTLGCSREAITRRLAKFREHARRALARAQLRMDGHGSL